MSTTWPVAEAKAHLSEVIERAMRDGPQTITRHGREAVVIVSADEWKRKTQRKGTLGDFLANSPLAESGIDLERIKGDLRDVDF